MAKVQSFSAVSLAKLQGVVMTVVGAFFGALYSFGGLLYDLTTTGGVNEGTVLAFGALVGMPLLFGVTGFVAGLVFVMPVNTALRKMGGIDAKTE